MSFLAALGDVLFGVENAEEAFAFTNIALAGSAGAGTAAYNELSSPRKRVSQPVDEFTTPSKRPRIDPDFVSPFKGRGNPRVVYSGWPIRRKRRRFARKRRSAKRRSYRV